MRAYLHAVLVLLGCSASLQAQSIGRTAERAVDSVVVQRTRCLGTCPAYRMSVRADGFVYFISHNSADRGREESHTRGPDLMRRIVGELARSEFFALPDITMGRAPYCRSVASDAPTITVTVFRGSEVRSLSYYTGCIGTSAQDTPARPFIRRLSALGDSIEVMAAGKGWIRPG